MSKILIIEDDLKIQKIYFETLTHEGFEVVQATAGKEGLSVVKGDGIDLIILDIMLPGGMNGFDVLEELKTDEKLKKIPVLVLTNVDSQAKVAREIGAGDYLVKTDTTIEEVVERVKAGLRGK